MLIYKKNIIPLALASLLVTAGCGCSKNTPQDIIDDPKDTTFVRYRESMQFRSNILQRTVRYSVYLPQGYDTSKVSYPVSYMLHGYGDNEKSWMQWGDLKRHADMRNAAGNPIPMIYVMPQGGNSYYVNYSSGSYRYMDMFVQELVPRIDSIYRTRQDAAQRAVIGYSMGGYGACILPSKHPDVFGISVALSMSWRTDSQYMAEPASVWDGQFGKIFGGEGTSGKARLTPYFKEHSPFHYFNTSNVEPYSSVRYLMYCGKNEERLFDTAEELHQLMNEKGIPHFYSTEPGGHDWHYWYGATRDALLRIDSLMNK